jgi:ectoine hydroxylase-related dioxygenase (phytanoyl-CoA dioxygenase family)
VDGLDVTDSILELQQDCKLSHVVVRLLPEPSLARGADVPDGRDDQQHRTDDDHRCEQRDHIGRLRVAFGAGASCFSNAYGCDVIHRLIKNLALLDPSTAPAESAQLERDGWACLPHVFADDEVARLRQEIDAVFDALPSERSRGDREQFRYEMLNRSAACQEACAHPRMLEVIEPLLAEDCHVIANTAWRNPPDFAGGPWHCDAGPHIPRAEDVPWDDRIPYPVFAVGAHIMLQGCTRADGPTAVVPASHRSGRLAPFDRMFDEDLTYDGRPPLILEADAGDVLLFVSDVWHRGLPATGGHGRYFLQVHYARRDIAQRIRPTADANQLSDDAIARATTERARTLMGLHDPFFYDG